MIFHSTHKNRPPTYIFNILVPTHTHTTTQQASEQEKEIDLRFFPNQIDLGILLPIQHHHKTLITLALTDLKKTASS